MGFPGICWDSRDTRDTHCPFPEGDVPGVPGVPVL